MKAIPMSSLLLVLIVLIPSSVARDSETPAQDVAGLVEELTKLRDDAEPDLVRQLAKRHTREALDGLIEVYDAMRSVYMRRVVMAAMVPFDDVPEADQVALQKLLDVATESEVRELRTYAVDCIADCENYGKQFLGIIVESSANDEVRELAMEYHSKEPRPDDTEWYKEIYKPSALVKARKASKKTAETRDKVPHKLETLRGLAFGVLASGLPDQDILEAVEDKSTPIRLRALQEVDARGIEEGVELAEKIYEQPTETASLRLVAVKILAKQVDSRFNKRLVKNALRSDSTREFAYGVADILAETEDTQLQSSIVKALGKGGDLEKIFYIRAGFRIEDPRVDKSLAKLAQDKKPEIQREAIAAMARRGKAEALSELDEITKKEKDPSVIAAAVEAISALGGTEAWPERLAELARHAEADVRNAAIREIGRSGDASQLSVLAEALGHEEWSTRLMAARAIEALRVDESVGILCARMTHEDGRMLGELGGILWRLTGQPFGNDAIRWNAWWEKEGNGFAVLTEGELAELEEREEEHRMRDITSSTFFGIRVLSHRVIFIIDISGSMEEPTRGQFVGEEGDKRINVAKKEIVKCLESLDVDSLFNIITFANSPLAWEDRVSEWTHVSIAEAKDFVKRQQALGGTNLFASLEMAFGDPIVDTIYILSDGEPTVGVTDPTLIRENVSVWNRNRGVEIHCIAVGSSLEILESLAADSGGQYVRIP